MTLIATTLGRVRHTAWLKAHVTLETIFVNSGRRQPLFTNKSLRTNQSTSLANVLSQHRDGPILRKSLSKENFPV